ncbi:MAG: ATP-binding protein, partial [Gammaproteobacteria bacterium]
MQPQALDFASDDARTGFRLHRFELLNWGTFDEHVWHIEPAGDNALVTGDIGSGKSTLVDALTTLLVPGQRIVYNKAAGAESRERTLLSYVRGEYKSEKDDLTQSARSVALRGPSKHTVLLARFHNEGYDQGLTLAQVLWVKDGQSRPERFFVVSETRLEIARDFAGFGTDILKLKQRLRRTDGVDVFDHFKPYATRFRHVFGIAQAQALDLFYQTVSMKSVGNLTDFVRGHMLERFDAQSRIDELRRNFENLNAAHEAVLKAKRQIGLLEPIVEDGKRYTDSSQSLAHSRRCRDALEHWFAAQVARLLDKRIARFEENQVTLSRRKERNDEALGRARAEELSIRIDIEASGGQRLRELEAGVERLIAERDRKHKAAEQYAALCRKAELDGTLREEIFVRTRKAAETQRQDIEQELEKNQQALVDCSVELKKKRQEHEELEAEIASLRARRSNIPRSMLALRDEMVATLELDAESLPFAGELLQVDEDERDWEGAIERVLHGFGLSMLVPEELYRQVARYVDRTHLRGRLVYFRAREPTVAARPAKADPRSLFR